MSDQVSFSGNVQMAIHVPALDRALAFYQGTLGLELLAESDGQLVFDAGEFTLYVNRDEQIRSFVPSFQVDDLDAAREALVEAGAQIETEHEAGFYFTDPFGFTVDVVGKD
jgi:catechol 2,3-dioxygenase-like lactoylglutathione lyase family enzyme